LTVSGFRLASRGDTPVHPPDPTPEPTNMADGGRGLLLVDSLAGHYGVEMRPDAKTIWAEFRLLTRTTQVHLGEYALLAAVGVV
jgi:hypothetical protein